jgi:hypothetical protein
MKLTIEFLLISVYGGIAVYLFTTVLPGLLPR